MGKRIKTRYVGIYYRYSEGRVLPSGKPDKCFDIHYKAGSKYIFEKAGWVSEGYTVDDAIELRGLRVKALRHPELSEQNTRSRRQPTVDAIWEVYKDKWLPHMKDPKKYFSMYQGHIQPVFGTKRIENISMIDIENFKLQLLSTPSPQNKTFQPGTVKRILKFFKSIIAKANTWGLTHGSRYNPLGRIDIKDSDVQRERYLTPQEAEKLLDACKKANIQTYNIVRIALYTGMRLGEILSLTGEQVNVEAGIIALNGKTGRRSAYIPDDLKSLFLKLIPEQPGTLLFPGESGQMIRSTTFSVRFARIVKTIGLNNGITDNLNKVVFHSLRHTYCSWLAIDGVPLYTIGQLVGHSNPEMTQRYAKLSPDSKRTAIEKISTMLEGKGTD